MRILLVEDEKPVAKGIQQALTLQGFSVEWVARASDAAAALALPVAFDVIVLDIGLPDRSGFDVLREYRAAGGEVPVLILTARHAVQDRVAGLNAGADDYIGKPFDIKELAARLRALHRRAAGRVQETLQYRNLHFDPLAHEVTIDDVCIALSRRESMLLHVLLENPGRIVSAERIHDQLYRWDEPIESNALAVHVHNLRRKLGRDVIETVRGVGYRVPRAAA